MRPTSRESRGCTDDFDLTGRVPERGVEHCPICGAEYDAGIGPDCQHSDDEWRAVVAQSQQRERDEQYARETAYQNEPMW